MSEQADQKGIYGKYIIQKADGTPVDPHAVYFTLRLDTDEWARRAMKEYAIACGEEQPELAKDIWRLLSKIERKINRGSS
jgi:hypothetical protein